MAQKKLAEFNFIKHGTPLIRIRDSELRSRAFRLIQAGRRWVNALGADKAWIRGMVVSFDFSQVHSPDDLSYVAGHYPNALFIGYKRDDGTGDAGYLACADLNGKNGTWLVPPNAIPDFNESATIGGALFLLRHLGSPQEVLVVSMVIANGASTADMAEAAAEAAERIAISRQAKESQWQTKNS